MSNFNNNIDKLVSKILNEEIENKVKQLSENIDEGEWTEIEVDEQLKGNQKKIDVAEPKGKITAADFKKLRDAKSHKEEVEEFLYEFEDEESDDDKDDISYSKEKLDKELKKLVITPGSNNNLEASGLFKDRSNFTKMMGSFDDEHGFYDQDDRQYTGDFDFDYDEEEFDDFDSFDSKYGGKQGMFDKGEKGKVFFNKYKDKFGKPFRVRTPRDMGEAETEEGNAFTGALADAKKGGKDSFEVDGKSYSVKEGKEIRGKFDDRKSKVIGVYSDIKKQREMKEEDKWIQKTNMEKGALHKKLGIPEGEKIPNSKLTSLKKELMKKSEGDKKLSADDSKLLKQVNLALTLKESKKPSLRLSEDELVDMIEKIVMEQKTKDIAEKENISKKSPEGLKKTEKVLGQNKKENDDYAQEVVKKMKGYMKDMFMGDKGYEENPDDFPQSNYDFEKDHKEKKYNPSEAVDEYIDTFAYPGMTNLVYDEIKPDDEMITNQIKGDSKNGNAITSKDGKALGNVSKRSLKVGDKFKKNYDENLYGAEQKNGSYKRVSQPVDVAGDKKQSGSFKKSQDILNKLESTKDKKSKMISEDMNKMKTLIEYNRKTQ